MLRIVLPPLAGIQGLHVGEPDLGGTGGVVEQGSAGAHGLFRNPLNAYSEVTRDSWDRGVIAVLNEYGYRPLKKELEVQSQGAERRH